MGADTKTYSYDLHNNASYYAYDRPIHAVANGKIVDVRYGLPENVPNSDKLAIRITDENIAGNEIIEGLGSGHFAAYAHLRPGTIKLKVGDVVHAGEVIAHLGNTGNSSEPHLRFQLCDAPSFLKSEGLPFAIAQFERDEHHLEKSASGADKLVISASHKIDNQEPMENELDSFVQPAS